MKFVNNGLYTIKDTYFRKFDKGFLCDNKQENRPYYYAIEDKNGIIWFIPLSTQLESYKSKIENDLKKHKECLFYCTGKVGGIERVFLIGNMFPVTKEYIKAPYTISNNHYIIKNKILINEIHKRATKYLALAKNGKIKSKADIIWIYNQLVNQNELKIFNQSVKEYQKNPITYSLDEVESELNLK